MRGLLVLPFRSRSRGAPAVALGGAAGPSNSDSRRGRLWTEGQGSLRREGAGGRGQAGTAVKQSSRLTANSQHLKHHASLGDAASARGQPVQGG